MQNLRRSINLRLSPILLLLYSRARQVKQAAVRGFTDLPDLSLPDRRLDVPAPCGMVRFARQATLPHDDRVSIIGFGLEILEPAAVSGSSDRTAGSVCGLGRPDRGGGAAVLPSARRATSRAPGAALRRNRPANAGGRILADAVALWPTLLRQAAAPLLAADGQLPGSSACTTGRHAWCRPRHLPDGTDHLVVGPADGGAAHRAGSPPSSSACRRASSNWAEWC